jgi:hypothetical protein
VPEVLNRFGPKEDKWKWWCIPTWFKAYYIILYYIILYYIILYYIILHILYILYVGIVFITLGGGRRGQFINNKASGMQQGVGEYVY